jgi:hypothetical protein
MILNSKKILYEYFNLDEKYKQYNIGNCKLNIIKNHNNYNIYRWSKFLDPLIKPDHFFYYFNYFKNRERLNPLINNIKILKNINNNEWIEKINMYDRTFNIKIHIGNYELLMYVIDQDLNETLGTYELFKFIIRQVDGKYLIRLELIFDIYDMDQEVEVINQIKTISKLESAILHSLG